jgi:hypothetical protein
MRGGTLVCGVEQGCPGLQNAGENQFLNNNKVDMNGASNSVKFFCQKALCCLIGERLCEEEEFGWNKSCLITFNYLLEYIRGASRK